MAESTLHEQIVDVLVMSPLSDFAGSEMAPFEKLAGQLLTVTNPIVTELATANSKLEAIQALLGNPVFVQLVVNSEIHSTEPTALLFAHEVQTILDKEASS